MTDATQTPPMPGAAVLYVDRGSELIVQQQSPGAGAARSNRRGFAGGVLLWCPGCFAGWPVTADGCATRRHPGRTVADVSQPARQGEMIVGGYRFLQEFESRDTVVLLLFPLATGRDPVFARPLGGGDVVAVLGLDNPASPTPPAPGAIAREMVDIRFGLMQIVPARDDVGLPVGSTIPVALRDTAIEQAPRYQPGTVVTPGPGVGAGAKSVLAWRMRARSDPAGDPARRKQCPAAPATFE